MIMAIVAIVALLLPWLAAYLAIGIVVGPLLLRHACRAYGMEVDHLRDTPVAIVCWIGLVAELVAGAAL